MTEPEELTSEDYRAALEKLKLSQVAAGEVFGVGPRTSRRYALGEAKIPTAVALLLRLMLKKRLTLEAPIMNDDEGRRRVWKISAEVSLE